MMSIAPQSISSNLRMMSDAQLAQYAKMHQNDPYIFPLAFQESQDRKALRAADTAKQAGQMTPPVNQQDLAQMMPQRAPQGMPQAPQAPQGMPAPQALPEEQGIGTLPAQNLQGMAGGGITGEQHFLGGGATSNPNDYLSVTTPGAMGGAQYYFNVPTNPRLNVNPNLKSLQGQYFPTSDAAMSAWKQAMSGAPAQAAPEIQQASAQPSYGDAASSSTIASLLGQDQPTAQEESANNNLTQPGGYKYMPPQIGLPSLMGSSAPTASGVKNTIGQFFNAGDYQKRYEDNFNNTLVELNDKQTAEQKMLANRPILGERLESVLNEEASKDAEKKEALKSMSLLDAGLAILSGTSPYALVNIGKGGAEGVKTYKEGVKDLDKAQKARDQAFAHIDDMRKAQIIGDQNRAMDANDKAFTQLQTARNHMIDGFTSLGIKQGDLEAHLYGQLNETANANARANMGVQAQVASANASLQKLPDTLLLPTVLGEGNINRGYADMNLAKHRENLANEWAKIAYPPNGMANQEFLNKFPSAQDYVSAATSTQPTGGQQGSRVVPFGQLPK